ncbi:hypothetical protein T190607A01A_20730 [Tenacibaculum sp. 190524A05c]|uniref:Uncharacterized protein n=1 Tax=Tenacibaculum platacis TaxID=3137852 RepID=A0ABM9P173_9FLAO
MEINSTFNPMKLSNTYINMTDVTSTSMFAYTTISTIITTL